MVFAAVQRLCMATPIVLYLLFSRPACFTKMAGNLPIIIATSLSELLVIVCFLKVRLTPPRSTRGDPSRTALTRRWDDGAGCGRA
jgi:hypothetical protein